MNGLSDRINDLTAELAAMTRLHEFSSRLLAERNLQSILEQVLDAIVELHHSDFGYVQLYDSENQMLEIVVQRGFRQNFLDYFGRLKDEGTSCRRALRLGRRVIIEDVMTDPQFESHRAIAASAGFRAVQSTPFLSGNGDPLGVTSTHFREPHRPSEQELRLTDLYARQASQLIERTRMEAALQRSEAHMAQGQRISQTGSCIWNPSTGELHWSREHCRIFGLEPDQGKITYEAFLKMVHPEDRTFVKETAKASAQDSAPFILEYRILRPDGLVSHIHAIGQPTARQPGKMSEFICTVMDITERKLAEEKLRRSEAYLADGQRLSHTASWAWNVMTGEILWSQELFRIYGFEPEKTSLDYPSLLNRIHADDRDRAQKTFEDAVRKKKDYELAYRVVRQDGTVRHLHNIAHPVFDNAGRLIEYVGTTIDTTERVQAEASLRESETRFRSYFELGLIGMAMSSPTKGILEVNDELCRIFGYERDELLQKNWLEMTHPEDLDADVAQFNRLLAGEINGYSGDKRWIRKDGRVIESITSVKCLPQSGGPVDHIVVLVLDTTERKQAEEKLRRSEANLAQGERISHTGSWTWNVATGECFWSLEHYRIFGLDPATFNPSRDNTQRLIHPDDLPAVQEILERAIRERSDFEVEYRLNHPDGSIRHHRGLGRPVLNGNDLIFTGSVMDITESKRAEEELRRTHEELAHVTRLTLIGELATSIGHEINQPLGAIVNNASACVRLFSQPGSEQEIRATLADIVSDAHRAGAIIARARALTRRTPFEKCSLSASDIVADVLAVSHNTLMESRITVQTEFPTDLPRFLGDRVQLQQVFLNLLMNSIEAMDGLEEERSVISIRGETAEIDGEAVVLISVRDHGRGFPCDQAEKLFAPFYTTKSQGMGMGLRISRSIVEAHAGRLWAACNAGPGATLFCALPAE